MVGKDVKVGLYKGPIFLNSNNSIQTLKKGFSYIDKPIGNTGHHNCDIWMIKHL